MLSAVRPEAPAVPMPLSARHISVAGSEWSLHAELRVQLLAAFIFGEELDGDAATGGGAGGCSCKLAVGNFET